MMYLLLRANLKCQQKKLNSINYGEEKPRKNR